MAYNVYDYWNKEDWIRHCEALEAENEILRDGLDMAKATFSEGFDKNKPSLFFLGGIESLNNAIDKVLVDADKVWERVAHEINNIAPTKARRKQADKEER
jgi:hypothetical protein